VCKTRDHTQLVLEYPAETPATDIATQLRRVPGLHWRVSGHRALIRWHKRNGFLRKLVVQGHKPQTRRAPPLDVWFGLGSEITNMSEHMSARFVDPSLPTTEVQYPRAKVFIVAEFETEARPFVEGLTSIDPELNWEASGTRALIFRGPLRPRHRALKAALHGARLLQFWGRPSIQSIQRAFREAPRWTNVRSEADWDALAEEEIWSSQGTADSSGSSPSA